MAKAIPNKVRDVGFARDFFGEPGQKRTNSSAIRSILDTTPREKNAKTAFPNCELLP